MYLLRFIFILLLSASTQAGVLTSIKPLELIVQELVPEGVVVSSLLPAQVSPHDYALKLTDLKRLKTTDFFVWVGPGMEPFLVDAVARFVPKSRQLQMSSDEIEVHHDGHDHSYSVHLWLSYVNAQAFASKLAPYIKRLYPEAKSEVDQKLANFKQLAAMEFEKTQRAFELSGKPPFFVYHDAYQEYVDEFKLAQLASIKVVPDAQLSLHRVIELNREADEARCLLVNLDEIEQAKSLAEKLKLMPVSLDLLGVGSKDVAPPSDYFSYMAQIRSAFLTCFAGGHTR